MKDKIAHEKMEKMIPPLIQKTGNTGAQSFLPFMLLFLFE